MIISDISMRSNDIIVAMLAGAMFRREGRLMREQKNLCMMSDELNRNFWFTFLILILVLMTISAKGITRLLQLLLLLQNSNTALSKLSLIIYGTLYHEILLGRLFTDRYLNECMEELESERKIGMAKRNDDDPY